MKFERVGKHWIARTASLTIEAHHHLDYDPDLWLVSAPPVLIACPMRAGMTAEEACAEAVNVVRSALATMLDGLDKPAPRRKAR